MADEAIVLDTETTGFVAPVVPIQVVYMSLGPDPTKIKPWSKSVALSVVNNRFDPGRDIEFGAMAAHGIEPDMVKGHPPWSEYTFSPRPAYFVGHQVDYDVDVIRSAIPNEAFTAKNICTLALARFAFPDCDVHKLAALAYYIKHKKLLVGYPAKAWDSFIKGAHDAAADIHLSVGVLKVILARMPRLKTWEDVYALSELARIPVTMPFGKHKGELIKMIPRSYKGWLLGTNDPPPEPAMAKAMTMTFDDWERHEAILRDLRGG